ncbi:MULTISPECIES: hypothetical protein [unclassified Wolbachia]|uniref:Jg18356 protein n=1 Tax=Pararge aegeria aegeria TaxID=348720 RepID=A0A8S4RG44_9NEOP|nr:MULTISPECIES: hypothetical protein [unclassified Wolbachia]CAH2235654.1 jg18356 [Pararge aegeria aegeria]
MLTNNNNTPSSAPPPPPPPPPANWEKNRKPAKNNDKDGKSPSVTAEKSSSGNKPRRDQSKSPVQQSSLNFAENPLFKKIQEKNNVDSKNADEGSKNSIHVKNPETRNSAQSKEEDNASDKTKNDRSNTKQGVPKKPMTEQHNGVHSDSENQKSSVAEQKKATALKYSIAILLLCTSGPVAGVCTYFIISAVLSSAAVPVSSAVIAFVSASVMLSLAAYLINSHLSAINSEKGVDPGRKQSQDLQKAKELEHSNTPTSSFPVMSGTPSAPPPPPPPPPSLGNNFPSGPATDADMFAEMKSKTLKKTDSFAGKPGGHNETYALFAEIKKGKKLMSKEERDKIEKKRLKEQEAKKSSNKGGGQQEKKEDLMADLNKVLLKRRAGLHGKQGSNVQQPSNLDGAFNKMSDMIPPPRSRSSSVSSSSSEEYEQDWSDNESTYSTPLNPQLDNKKRRDSSDSGHESDDNVKPKSTTPPRSTLKAEKPPISPKPVNSKTKSEASSPTKTNTVELASSEMQESSTVSVQEIRKRFE